MKIIPYLTQEGDRWDLIAFDHYGDATAYAPIVAANRHAPIAPILPGGLRLEIPVLDSDGPAIAALPPWKRS